MITNPTAQDIFDLGAAHMRAQGEQVGVASERQIEAFARLRRYLKAASNELQGASFSTGEHELPERIGRSRAYTDLAIEALDSIERRIESEARS